MSRSEELYDEWLENGGGPDYAYSTFLEERIERLESAQEPRAVLLSLTKEDLVSGKHIAESDIEFVTQEMLDEIVDTMWNSDDDDWNNMFSQWLGATMSDNWQYWHDMIAAEKKRQQDSKSSD